MNQALIERLGQRVTVLGQPVGMHLCARVRTSAAPNEIAMRARQRGVGIYPLAAATRRAPTSEATFVFGFGNVETDTIPRGIAIFASLLRR